MPHGGEAARAATHVGPGPLLRLFGHGPPGPPARVLHGALAVERHVRPWQYGETWLEGAAAACCGMTLRERPV